MANSCWLSRARSGGAAGSRTLRCSVTPVRCGPSWLDRHVCRQASSEPQPPTTTTLVDRHSRVHHNHQPTTTRNQQQHRHRHRPHLPSSSTLPHRPHQRDSENLTISGASYRPLQGGSYRRWRLRWQHRSPSDSWHSSSPNPPGGAVLPSHARVAA